MSLSEHSILHKIREYLAQHPNKKEEYVLGVKKLELMLAKANPPIAASAALLLGAKMINDDSLAASARDHLAAKYQAANDKNPEEKAKFIETEFVDKVLAELSPKTDLIVNDLTLPGRYR